MRFSVSMLVAFAFVGMASATYDSTGNYGSGTGSYGSDTGSYGGGSGSYGGSGNYGGDSGGYTPATPSSTPYDGYQCPDSDKNGNSWDESKCDKPPFSSSTIGCSFHNGKGTGLTTCAYDATSGDCLSDAVECPAKALLSSEYRKKRRSALARAAAPAPGGADYHKRLVKKRSGIY
ncbi:hypothetical protein CPB85DRAFT_1437096 [Mucidula mucida]|nr:hypothetical protein CPB85DRAFT_1437096 [Mucidula mucida]